MKKRKLMLDREVLSSDGREEVKGASDLGCPGPGSASCVYCPSCVPICPSPIPCPDDTN